MRTAIGRRIVTDGCQKVSQSEPARRFVSRVLTLFRTNSLLTGAGVRSEATSALRWGFSGGLLYEFLEIDEFGPPAPKSAGGVEVREIGG